MKGAVRALNIICALLCAAPLLFCSAAAQQRTWRQVYKADAQIQSLKIIRPLDNTVPPSIIINQSKSNWVGKYCQKYHPDHGEIEKIGPDSCLPPYYDASSEYGGQECDYRWWEDEALYDAARTLSLDKIVAVGSYQHVNLYFYTFDAIHLTGNFKIKTCTLDTVNESYQPAYPSNAYSNQIFFFHPTDGTILFCLTDSGLVQQHFSTCPGNVTTWPYLKRAAAPDYFFIDRDNPEIIFLGTKDSLWQSSDAGASWLLAGRMHADAIVRVPHSTAFVAGSSDSNLSGLYPSQGNGFGFQARTISSPVFSIDAEQSSGIIFIGTHGAILQSSDGGKTVSLFDSTAGGHDAIGVAAIDGKIIYADTGGVYETDSPNDVHEIFLPKNSSLENFPNPFSTRTIISWNTISNINTTTGMLTITNALGERVQSAPVLNANGRCEFSFDAATLPAGSYCCRVQFGEYQTQKILLLVK